MMSLPTNLIRPLITAMLALSLSVCCCQAHILLHGLSAADTYATGAAAAIDSVPSCCAGCTDESPPAAPGPEDDPTPTKGCQTCCIKGIGLKDIGPQLPHTAVAFPAVVAAAPTIVPFTQPLAGTRGHVDMTQLRVEPRTLVRLHCALLV